MNMKPLLFCIFVGICLLLDIILLNFCKTITETTTQIICTFILCLSLSLNISIFIVWLLEPCHNSQKCPIIVLFSNLTCNIIKTIVFMIFYNIQQSVSQLFPLFSFLNLALCVVIPGIYHYENSNSIWTSPKESIFEIELDVVQYKEGNEGSCVICLEDFKIDEQVNQTKCNHLFHIVCLEKSIQHNIKNCPICRTSLMIEIEDIEVI